MEMPTILRWFTFCCGLMGFVVVVVSMLPGWKDENDVSHSVGEFWADGSGPTVFSIGICLMGVAFIIYRGFSWGRHVLAAVVCVLHVLEAFSRNYVVVSLALAAGGIALTIWYLYFKRDVRACFTGNPSGGI